MRSLPAAVQPADPCALLTVNELASQVGSPVRQPKAVALPADIGTGQRDCFWEITTTRNLIGLRLHTAASLAASVIGRHGATLRSLVHAPPGTGQMVGVDDAQAWFETLTGVDAGVWVLTSAAVFRLTAAGPQPLPESRYLTLAADIVRRLAPGQR